MPQARKEAGPPRFELGLLGSKPRVLPLHHGPVVDGLKSEGFGERPIGSDLRANHRGSASLHPTEIIGRNACGTMENFTEFCCRSRGGTDHATYRWTQHRNQTPSIGTIPVNVARSGASWLTVRVRGRSGREHTQSREGVPHEAPGFTCHPRSRSRSLPESRPRKKGVRFAK